MKIEIKNRWNGDIIISGEYESVKEALQKNRDADFRGADLCDADLYEADLRDANLCRADLRDADLRDANLCRADLRDADLCDADLYEADLRDANLRGVKGITLPIINITGSSFHFFYIDGIIKIGCEYWPVDHWIENYEKIGHAHNFSPEQIAEYGGYIKMVENLIKEKK